MATTEQVMSAKAMNALLMLEPMEIVRSRTSTTRIKGLRLQA
jgi:hypothetical protein